MTRTIAGIAAVLACWCGTVAAQILGCDDAPKPPFCSAVAGPRASGWPQQTRSEVMARHGMVATSQPLAAQVGLDILKRGGNAMDAAVAMSAMLNVTEPMMEGIAGDVFAIIYVAKEKKLYALNASGRAPSGATVERLNSLGYAWDPRNWAPGSGMPSFGILAVTVPGTVWGWSQVLERFGTMTFKETLQPAIDYAEEGFPVSERIAHDWRLPKSIGAGTKDARGCCTAVDPDSIATWYIDGRPPRPGQTFRNRDLAKTLRILQARGADGFYKGEVARAVVAKSDALGGSMTLADLAGYKGEWNTPAGIDYHGYGVFTLPPPAQTWATAEMLSILQACMPVWSPAKNLAALGPGDPQFWHFMVEAKKLAFRDLYTYNADPHFARVPVDRLLSPAYAASLCKEVDPRAASKSAAGQGGDGTGDTIVLSAADRWGNMVSWVNSNYAVFGSGLTVPGYGFILHNRGALFSLDPKSPNAIAPHKQPFNTLSASFVMKGERPLMTITLMGGDMQAQGHAQVIVNILDLGANMQAASDMARFRHVQVPNILQLEAPLYGRLGSALQAMGHSVVSENGAGTGGFQSIMFTPDASAAGDGLGGFYRAGSDHRKDGMALGY